MEGLHLSREYLINWLESYALEEGEYVNDYVSSYLSDRYFNAQVQYLESKDRDELRDAILSEIYPSAKRNIRKMVENSDTETLAKIVLSMQSSIQRGSELDDISNLPIETVNEIFIDFIQDLPVEKLKEIVSLFLTHSDYLNEDEEEDDWTEGSENEDEEVERNEEEPEEGEIKEYFVHVSDDVLLEKIKEYKLNKDKI